MLQCLEDSNNNLKSWLVEMAVLKRWQVKCVQELRVASLHPSVCNTFAEQTFAPGHIMDMIGIYATHGRDAPPRVGSLPAVLCVSVEVHEMVFVIKFIASTMALSCIPSVLCTSGVLCT